jgi:hypothetical protein
MLQTQSARIAGAMLASILIGSTTLPAKAGLVGGVAGTVGGVVGGTLKTVGGVVGGAIGGTAGGVGGALSGPGSTLAAASGAASNAGYLGGWNMAPQVTDQLSPLTSNIPRVSPAMRATIAEALRQRVTGRVDAVANGRVRLTQPNGATRTLGVSPAIASALRAYVGKNVALRTLDGSTATELVGRTDTVRGTVTSLDGGYVGFMSPTGLSDVVQLAPSDAAKLRVGERIVATSSDFGRSMQLSTLGTAPTSTLADVYVGRVTSVTPNTASLRIGSRTQAFGIDPSLAGSLRTRVGKVVALDVPDGTHAKGMISVPTLQHLVGATPGGPLGGTVVGSTRDRLTVQLPNGDTSTMTGPVAALNARVGTTVGIAPLDRTHVRVTSGSHAARLADANACVTVNATCSQTMSGRAIAVSPTTMAVRLSNGDVRTYLGQIPSTGATAGVPVTITPLDSTHARVSASGRAANLLNADACVTINSGCHAGVGSIDATGNGRTVVTMPDGSQATVLGTLANASVGSPILLQPLDSAHMVAMTGGSIGSVGTANACGTLNASCGSGGNGAGTARNGSGNRAAANVCASVNAPLSCGRRRQPATGGSGMSASANACVGVNVSCTKGTARGTQPIGSGAGNPGSGGNLRGPGNGAGPGGGSGGAGAGSNLPFGNGTLLVDPSDVVAAAFTGGGCGDNGELIARAGDASTGRALAGVRVHVWGAFETTVSTGPDGRATIARLPLGAYRATFSRPGYRATRPVAVTIGCTTASILDGHLARAGARAASTAALAFTGRLDKAAARKAAYASTFCVANGKGTACAKRS